MSRRHGRAHHHERPRHEGPKTGTPPEARAVRAAEAGSTPAVGHLPIGEPTPPAQDRASGAPRASAGQPRDHLPEPARASFAADGAPAASSTAPVTPSAPASRPIAAVAAGAATGPSEGGPGPGGPVRPTGLDRAAPCTAPQLRRFIKSRPYVPMHELRRRFAIDGGDDDVSPVEMPPGRIYVGLPSREGELLGELLRAGEIGYELSLDPRTPIVVGVYPMRPVPRA